MTTPTQADTIKSALARVIANAKAHISTKPFEAYKQNEQDCLTLRAYIEGQPKPIIETHRWDKSKFIRFNERDIPSDYKYKLGDYVRKKGDKGQWHGAIVGFYSTECTIHGYAVESVYEANSVQIYPESALEPWSPDKIILNREDVK